MLEQDYTLDLDELHLILDSLKCARFGHSGYSPEMRDAIIKILDKIANIYTSDREVKLMVFKEPLLR